MLQKHMQRPRTLHSFLLAINKAKRSSGFHWLGSEKKSRSLMSSGTAMGVHAYRAKQIITLLLPWGRREKMKMDAGECL